MKLMSDYIIPECIANTVRHALNSIGDFSIDRESLITANILAYDGEVDEREVDRQLEWFKLDETYGRLCEEAPKGSSSNIVWMLHGGVRARNWLNKIKRQAVRL